MGGRAKEREREGGRHKWKPRQYYVTLKPMKQSTDFSLNFMLCFLSSYEFKVSLGEDKEAVLSLNLLLVFSDLCYVLAGRTMYHI